MPATLTITSLNSVYMLSVTGVYSVPQQIQGFAVDAAFATEDADQVETKLGVDGILSGGLVAVSYMQTISLQADSASNIIFDTWASAQRTAGDLLIANATVTIPGLGRKWTMARGFLKRYRPIPEARKTLEARVFGIEWNTITPAVYVGP